MKKRRNTTQIISKAKDGGKRFVAALLPESDTLLNDKRYYGPMIQGLTSGLMERDVQLRPLQCLQDFQQQKFLSYPPDFYAGVVFVGPIYKQKKFIEAVVARFSGPKVMLDHHFDDIAMHSVREDAMAGMRMVAEHLIALGHRRLAYLDLSDQKANPWKREGVDVALRQAGLPGLSRGWVAGCRDNFTDIAAALDWFLDLTPRPTGVVCCDDTRALLLLQAAAERGLRVPEDISITGFGDFAVPTGRSQILTSVRVDTAVMGHKAAEILTGAPDAKPVSLLVPPQLISRGSATEPVKPVEEG